MQESNNSIIIPKAERGLVMTEHLESIDIYGKCVDDFDVSPFESIEMLHRRSNLDRVFDELNQDERISLLNYDLQLIKNAKKMTKHIAEVYDFSSSDEPLRQWWWHLDKVAEGKISFRLIPDKNST